MWVYIVRWATLDNSQHPYIGWRPYWARLCILHGGLICVAFCLSGLYWSDEFNPYLGKYWSYQSATLPQYREFLRWFRKNLHPCKVISAQHLNSLTNRWDDISWKVFAIAVILCQFPRAHCQTSSCIFGEFTVFPEIRERMRVQAHRPDNQQEHGRIISGVGHPVSEAVVSFFLYCQLVKCWVGQRN